MDRIPDGGVFTRRRGGTEGRPKRMGRRKWRGAVTSDLSGGIPPAEILKPFLAKIAKDAKLAAPRPMPHKSWLMSKMVTGVSGKVSVNVNRGIGPSGVGSGMGDVGCRRGVCAEALAGRVLDGRKEEGRERICST